MKPPHMTTLMKYPPTNKLEEGGSPNKLTESGSTHDIPNRRTGRRVNANNQV